MFLQNRRYACFVADESPFPHRNLPLMTGRKLQRLSRNTSPKQAWLETLSSIQDEKLGIVDLHPDIFSTFPRYFNY